MKLIVCWTLAFVCAATTAAAQTEGRVSVGASVTWVRPTDRDVESAIGIGPLVRLNPKKGWGPAGALNWFRADLAHPEGAPGSFGRLRVRPLMAGVAYTVGTERVLTSFSIVAGPSFNRAELRDEFVNATPAGFPPPRISAERSFAVRPGVNVTWTLASRTALIGFGGYLINRPDVTFTDETGRQFRDRWRADALVLSIGAVYSLF